MRPPELSDLVGRLRATLGERLSGLYLYGSAVCGGYTNGVSDLDLLAVTARALDPADLTVLAALHDRFSADHLIWRDRIEVLYIAADELAGFRERPATGALVSPASRCTASPLALLGLRTCTSPPSKPRCCTARRRRGCCRRSPIASS